MPNDKLNASHIRWYPNYKEERVSRAREADMPQGPLAHPKSLPSHCCKQDYELGFHNFPRLRPPLPILCHIKPPHVYCPQLLHIYVNIYVPIPTVRPRPSPIPTFVKLFQCPYIASVLSAGLRGHG